MLRFNLHLNDTVRLWIGIFFIFKSDDSPGVLNKILNSVPSVGVWKLITQDFIAHYNPNFNYAPKLHKGEAPYL